jgi:sialidase-1
LDISGHDFPIIGTFRQAADWHGFARTNFSFEGRGAFVTRPATNAPGHPWVWRTSFPDFHAEVDIALLKQGFHVAHVDVVSMLGCDASLTSCLASTRS